MMRWASNNISAEAIYDMMQDRKCKRSLREIKFALLAAAVKAGGVHIIMNPLNKITSKRVRNIKVMHDEYRACLFEREKKNLPIIGNSRVCTLKNNAGSIAALGI